MKLIEFMELLKSASAYVGAQEPTDERYASPTKGIECRVCLTADGDISAEETAIAVSFFIPPNS